FVRFATVEEGRPHDHVRIAVTVDVARRPDGVPRLRPGLVALRSPVREGGESSGGSLVKESSSFTSLSVGVIVGADDDLRVSIAVDVACCRNRKAENGVRLISLGGPGRDRGEARGGAEVDEDPSFLTLA